VDSWLAFWTGLLIGAFTLFAGLAVVVAIGGFADARAMFRSVDAQHRSADRSQDER
jgi:uncharacterized membrane protein